jgi:hypothetical protein
MLYPILLASELFASYSKLYPILNSASLKSISFFLAYLAQIPLQHLLNALMVYTPSSILPLRTQYLPSLARSYAAYTNAIVLTTLINYALIDKMGLPRGKAFLISVYGVGVLNFFILGRMMNKKKAEVC